MNSNGAAVETLTAWKVFRYAQYFSSISSLSRWILSDRWTIVRGHSLGALAEKDFADASISSHFTPVGQVEGALRRIRHHDLDHHWPCLEIGDEAASKTGGYVPSSVCVLNHMFPSVPAPQTTSDQWTASLIRIGDASG